MFRSSGAIQSTSSGHPYSLTTWSPNQMMSGLYFMHCCLYCKGMTIGPRMRYLILDALECKRMKMPPMYRNAYLSPRHHGRKKIPWLPFHPATTSITTQCHCHYFYFYCHWPEPHLSLFFAHFLGKMVALGFVGWATSWLLGWASSYQVVVGYFEVARHTSQLVGIFLKWVTNFLVG